MSTTTRLVLIAIWITFILILGNSIINKAKQNVGLLDFQSSKMDELFHADR